MLWQDWVIAIGQVIFAVALLPTVVRGGPYPALSTCWLTGGTLVVFAVTFSTLGLYWSCATTFVAAALWIYMATEQMR